MIAGTELLEALPVAVYTTDADGRLTFYNQAAAEFWGHNPELGSSQWCGSWRLFRLDGQPLLPDECPMALALKEGRAVRGIEAFAERPDGTRVRFRPYPTPLRDAKGRLVGAINLLMDVTDEHDSHFESERLAAIVVSSDDAIISKTLDGRITSWNAGATRIFGYDANEIIGQSILRIIPPELHGEEREILARLQLGERIDHYETLRVAKDGRRVDVSLTVSPLRDRSGKVIGASKVGRDITERKRAEKLQRVLTDELSHRVKNTLATVHAIASQSLARAKSPVDFVAGFGGRLQALANAHTLLTRSQMQGADVMTLVNEQVVIGGGGDRISCSGPLLMLDPQASVHLALVLHELATNARKYGALSVPGGRLSVTWEMRTNGACSLFLSWKESDGPEVSAPRAHGFGRALIEETARSYGGHVSVHYHRDGLTCEIDLPLPERPPAIVGPNIAAPKIAVRPSLLAAPDQRRTLEGKCILVIEDEPLVSMELESELAASGCEVVGPAATLAEAKTLVEDSDYDAALLDVNLKGQPVDELANLLTKKNRPFAFVTGYGRDALPSGFRGAVVLGKPFSGDQLLATAEVLLYQADRVVQLRHKKP